jgi:hypothetical protein
MTGCAVTYTLFGHQDFVRVSRAGRGFREEPIRVEGWLGSEPLFMTAPGCDEMDCYVLPGGKVFAASDQKLVLKELLKR